MKSQILDELCLYLRNKNIKCDVMLTNMIIIWSNLKVYRI